MSSFYNRNIVIKISLFIDKVDKKHIFKKIYSFVYAMKNSSSWDIARKISQYNLPLSYGSFSDRVRIATPFMLRVGEEIAEIFHDVTTQEFAIAMDNNDSLATMRSHFHLPQWYADWQTIDFRGNSLGAQPKETEEILQKELYIWAKEWHEGHFVGKPSERLPRWIYHENFQERLAPLVWSKPHEVIQMGTLSANNVALLQRFYYMAKRKGKEKILIEQWPFPSDWDNVAYTIAMQNGILPEEVKNYIVVVPRREDNFIHHEDIAKALSENKDIGIVFLGAINYYTWQLLDIKNIAQSCNEHDVYIWLDLAHAFANVPLDLHNQWVDFATSCSYKYANSGAWWPGIAYVHEKNHGADGMRIAAGRWWRDKSDRFNFDAKDPSKYTSAEGIRRILMSNDAIYHQAPLIASLNVFEKTTIQQMRHKSLLLTGYLEYLLDTILGNQIHIITPRDPKQRGAQISFQIQSNKFANPKEAAKQIHDILHTQWFGVEQRDDVIRVAPVPLYNTFQEIRTFVFALKGVL